MTALENFQFEILQAADDINGFVFGIGADVSLDDGGFIPDSTAWITQDGKNSRNGRRAFGRDVQDPGDWSWATHVDQDDEIEAMSIVRAFAKAWVFPEAHVSGAFTSVRYRLVDQTRRVFGRPRNFSAPMSNRMLSGYIPVTHDFSLVDPYTYDDLESSIVLPFTTSVEGGGFEFPLTFPYASLPSEGSIASQIYVGGDVATYPIIRFEGPWTDPGMVTDDWELQLEGTIPSGRYVEIDTRPWVKSVLSETGGSAAGYLRRDTRLESCAFQPDSQPQISLTGSAPGGAQATIRWRAAYEWL